MSSSKHLARATGVGVGVAVLVLVLGLPGTASAAPTITAVSPTSGPTDCVVVITGTGFGDFPKADQELIFVGPAAGTGDDVAVADADWLRISAGEIWAVVPTLVPGTTYTVTLTDPNGGTSTGTFFSTTGAGGCAPRIDAFVPSCGEAGTTMVIGGTNLLGPDLAGGEVRFSPHDDPRIAPHAEPGTPTSLTVIVPSGAAVGLIRVTTFATTGGTTSSAVSFSGPCHVDPGLHARTVTLRLLRRLVARGRVRVEDEFAECAANVPVKIQRRNIGGGWKTVRSTTTSSTGSYRKRIPDRPGKYRAVAPAFLENFEACFKAVSPRVRHRH